MKKILSVLTAGIVLAGSLLVASCKLEESDTIQQADTITGLGLVQNLKAEASYGSVLLTWDAVSDAAAYAVVRYDEKGANGSEALPYGGDVFASTGVKFYNENGKKKCYFVDSEIETAGKYVYGVKAKAKSSGAATVAPRVLYVADGVEAKTAAVDVAFTAPTADLVKDVVVADKGERWNGWNITFPTAEYATVEYKFAVATSYATIATLTEDVFATDSAWVALSSSDWAPNSTKIMAGNSSTTAGTLFVAVRAKKHTSEKWTIVNTGKTVLPTANTGSLNIRSNVVNASNANRKYELFITDTFTGSIESTVNGGTAAYTVVDSPANYTYVLKGYKVDYSKDIFGFTIPSTPTVTKDLTLNVVDGTSAAGNKTWGTEYVTGELKDEDLYYYVVVKTHKVKGTVTTVATALSGYTYTATAAAYDLTYNLSFTAPLTPAVTPVVATATTTASTNYTYNFSYTIGNDYTDVKVYRAAVNAYGTTQPAITAEFKEFTMTDTTSTLPTYYKNGVIGTKSHVVNILATQTTTSNQTYVYALVGKSKTTGAYHVVYATASVIQ